MKKEPDETVHELRDPVVPIVKGTSTQTVDTLPVTPSGTNHIADTTAQRMS